jgi:hypothetical protein
MAPVSLGYGSSAATGWHTTDGPPSALREAFAAGVAAGAAAVGRIAARAGRADSEWVVESRAALDAVLTRASLPPSL